MITPVSRDVMKAALENALLTKPALVKPHLSIPTFLDLPLTLGPLLRKDNPPVIRGLVLDNDNTLSPSRDPYFHPAYVQSINTLKNTEPFSLNKNSILIVSNRAGAKPEYDGEVEIIERELGLPVLHHKGEKQRKPVIAQMVLEHFSKHGVTDKADEIAVVGDRIITDVCMARLMGSWSVYVTEGWKDPENPRRKRGSIGWGEWFFTAIERYGYGNVNSKAQPIAPNVDSLAQFLKKEALKPSEEKLG